VKLLSNLHSYLRASMFDLVGEVPCETSTYSDCETLSVFVVTREKDGARRAALLHEFPQLPRGATYLTREEALQMAAALSAAAAKLSG
jgi:hypothetical protein